MPLIEIIALPQSEDVDPAAVLSAVNRAVGVALGRPAESAWSTWRTLEPGHYAVGEQVASEQPRETHPPVVHIWAERPPEALRLVVDAVCTVLGEQLGLDPGSIFVTTSRVSPAEPAPGT